MKSFLLLLIAASLYSHQQKTSLTVLISKNNHFFFYQNSLAKDASNLKRGSYLIITDWSEYLKKQNGDDNVAFNIKVEDNDSLHAIAKKLVDYFKTQKHSEFSSLTKEEEKLLRLNEKAIAAREE